MSTYLLLRRIALWCSAPRCLLLRLCCVCRSILLGTISSSNCLNRLLCAVTMLRIAWARWLLHSCSNSSLLLMVQDLSWTPTNTCQDQLIPTNPLLWVVDMIPSPYHLQNNHFQFSQSNPTLAATIHMSTTNLSNPIQALINQSTEDSAFSTHPQN